MNVLYKNNPVINNLPSCLQNDKKTVNMLKKPPCLIFAFPNYVIK